MTLGQVKFLVAAAVLGAAMAGCSSSTTSGTDAGPDAGPTDAGVDAAADAATDAAADAAADAATDAAMTGMCTDTSDQGVISSQDVSSIAENCGISCLTSTDPNCVASCVVTQTGMGGMTALSMACAGCYQIAVQCAATNCLSECTSGDMTACDTCYCGSNPDMVNCDTMFTDCAGFTTTRCSM